MLSRWLIPGLVVLTTSFSTAAMAASSPSTAGGNAQPAAAGAQAIEVDPLMKAPEKYPGTIRVRGMVRKVYAKERRLGLIDAQYLNCCTAPCDSGSLLPVTWTGDMPAIGTLVVVTGETRQTGGAFEFVGKSLETAQTPPSAAR